VKILIPNEFDKFVDLYVVFYLQLGSVLLGFDVFSIRVQEFCYKMCSLFGERVLT